MAVGVYPESDGASEHATSGGRSVSVWTAESRSQEWMGGPARKPTKFMTNSVMIARELNLRCQNDHEHVQLMSGRAGPAARYPKGLCEAICMGVGEAKEDGPEGARAGG